MMSVHDITDTRRRAAAILSGKKLRMLEDAGLIVVEESGLRRVLEALERAPWPRDVDHDGYWSWYERELDPAMAEVGRILRR